jgi:hypothetical protein
LNQLYSEMKSDVRRDSFANSGQWVEKANFLGLDPLMGMLFASWELLTKR